MGRIKKLVFEQNTEEEILDEYCTDLVLPYPPSVNNYWRTMYSTKNRKIVTYISSKGKEFRKNVVSICKNVFNIKNPIDGDVMIRIIMIPPDKRKRDIDNILKPLLDALQHACVYNDDSQVTQLYINKIEKGDDPRVEIKIIELKNKK